MNPNDDKKLDGNPNTTGTQPAGAGAPASTPAAAVNSGQPAGTGVIAPGGAPAGTTASPTGTGVGGAGTATGPVTSPSAPSVVKPA